MTETTGLRIRGQWPDRVLLAHGWGRAHARPWNNELDAAHLRLERGSARFLTTCTEWVGQLARPVISPALLPHRLTPWIDCGFEVATRLLLFEHDLVEIPTEQPEVLTGVGPGLEELAKVDELAFAPAWRTTAAGLAESLEATQNSVVQRIERENSVAGFSISGIALGTAYLQRLAVRPEWQGQGIGNDLVTSALLWARRQGAQAMLVNTQLDNPARNLYRARGFRPISSGLVVLSAFGNLF